MFLNWKTSVCQGLDLMCPGPDEPRTDPKCLLTWLPAHLGEAFPFAEPELQVQGRGGGRPLPRPQPDEGVVSQGLPGVHSHPKHILHPWPLGAPRTDGQTGSAPATARRTAATALAPGLRSPPSLSPPPHSRSFFSSLPLASSKPPSLFQVTSSSSPLLSLPLPSPSFYDFQLTEVSKRVGGTPICPFPRFTNCFLSPHIQALLITSGMVPLSLPRTPEGSLRIICC